MSLGRNNQSLWVVSDAPDNEIYEISLQGTILQKLPFNGDDLEGIVFDSLNNVLWVVEERKQEIVKVGLDGSELFRTKINITSSDAGGLEGISIDAANDIWLVNEKEPGLLISLLKNFSINNRIVLEFAQDYSGLSYSTQSDHLWIVSDESNLLVQYDLENKVLVKYNLWMKKVEGVAVDETNQLIYIVSESEQKLYTFKLPD